MLPVQPAESTRAVIGRFARALGREISITRVPSWVLRAVGVFQPTIREVAEMTYQWRQPFVVEDAKFRAAFGFGPTPWGTTRSLRRSNGRGRRMAARPTRGRPGPRAAEPSAGGSSELGPG